MTMIIRSSANDLPDGFERFRRLSFARERRNCVRHLQKNVKRLFRAVLSTLLLLLDASRQKSSVSLHLRGQVLRSPRP